MVDLLKRTERLGAILHSSDACIFDFDGLIADSEPYHYRAYYDVFKQFGHHIDPDEYWVEFTSKGGGIKGEIERYQLDIDLAPEQLREQKFEIYSRFCNSGEIKLFDQAIELVTLLKKKFPVAIASGSWGHDIRAILRNADAEPLFPVILGKEAASREKPFPDIFLEAARALEVAPEKCFVLEDALKGMKAARQAGMHCIIVRNKLNMGIEFKEASFVTSGLAELIELIKGL